LAVWGQTYGQAFDHGTLPGDADGDQRVEGADFLAWQRNQSHLSAANALGLSHQEPQDGASLEVARDSAFDEILRQGVIGLTAPGESITPIPPARVKHVTHADGQPPAPAPQASSFALFRESAEARVGKLGLCEVFSNLKSDAFSWQKSQVKTASSGFQSQLERPW
jgi:hypothetical protein